MPTTRKKPEPEPDTSAAFAPLPPPPPQEATYRVVGTQPVYDTLPGETFTATLPVEQENLLTEYGHIQKEEKA
jgi:hypothetical protein